MSDRTASRLYKKKGVMVIILFLIIVGVILWRGAMLRRVKKLAGLAEASYPDAARNLHRSLRCLLLS